MFASSRCTTASGKVRTALQLFWRIVSTPSYTSKEKLLNYSSRHEKMCRLLLLFPSLFHKRMGLLTAAVLALGRHFVLSLGLSNSGNSRTRLGSLVAGQSGYIWFGSCWSSFPWCFLQLKWSDTWLLAVVTFKLSEHLLHVLKCCRRIKKGVEGNRTARDQYCQGFSSSRGSTTRCSSS